MIENTENSAQTTSETSSQKSGDASNLGVSILSAQVTLNNSIFLMSQLDFELIKTLIANTPDNLKNTVQYNILVLTLDYYNGIVEVYKKYTPKPAAE